MLAAASSRTRRMKSRSRRTSTAVKVWNGLFVTPSTIVSVTPNRMAASGNIHPGKTSMFEPVHGSAPPIAGKNIANPFGAILTAAMMLNHLGLNSDAEKIEAAVLEAVRQKKTTQDIGGSLRTKEAGDW